MERVGPPTTPNTQLTTSEQTMTTTLKTVHQQHHALTADAVSRVILSTTIEPADSETGAIVSSIGATAAVYAIFDADDDTASQELRDRARARFRIELVEGALRSSVRFAATLVTPEHPHWPTRMNDLGTSAPFALWVRGDTELLTDANTVAVIGARAATGYGEHITMEITAGLVERGYSIASGAAYGVDGMAHRAALASGGRTIAYLAGGVDKFYPAGHDALLTRIVEKGAVVSEQQCGAPPTRCRHHRGRRTVRELGHRRVGHPARTAARCRPGPSDQRGGGDEGVGDGRRPFRGHRRHLPRRGSASGHHNSRPSGALRGRHQACSYRDLLHGFGTGSDETQSLAGRTQHLLRHKILRL